jgi:hypothetical protein
MVWNASAVSRSRSIGYFIAKYELAIAEYTETA